MFAINKDSWSNFKLALHDIAKNRLTTSKGKELLQQFVQLSIDSSNKCHIITYNIFLMKLFLVSYEYELLRLLPKLLKSTVEIKYKKQLVNISDGSACSSNKKRKSVKKITELEQMDAWIKHFSTAEIALKYIDDKRAGYRNIGADIKFQLLVTLIGPTIEKSEIIVFFDNFQYKVDSLIEAFSLSFQIFFVFNSQYSIECENCWKLIQTHFYKIVEEGQTISANVIDMRIEIDDFLNQVLT